ncbi:MAG: hypothetical protein SNJ71_00340 [Bacteroidales bacterium]
MNKIVFKVKDYKDPNGGEIELVVMKPNASQAKEIKKHSNKIYAEAVSSGALLRSKVEAVAIEQGIWSEAIEKKIADLRKELFNSERKLAQGGKAGLTKKMARELALRMRDIRAEIIRLNAPRNSIDANTAEAQAQNEAFNYQVYLCTYYASGIKEGRRYFDSYDDYISNGNSDAAIQAAQHMMFLEYGIDPNYERNLPEIKFLCQYGFVNDNLQLVDSKGRLINREGRLINEKGNFVDEEGNLVDSEGNRINEDGSYVVEFEEFLEDED